MSFSEQLRRARSASGRTQREIAEALHVTTSTYCGYETGKRQPDIVKLRQLSLLLHVSCDALLETRSESDADPSIDAQARRLLSIFSSLRPEYRSYALDQIQKLAELQNGSSQPIAPPSNP